MIHLAFMHPKYLDMVISGEKTVESRFVTTKRKHPAFSCQPGHYIAFKRTGGDVEARAGVRAVHRFYDLQPEEVDRIRSEWNDRICADDEFWDKKYNSKQAVLIELEEVVTIRIDKREFEDIPFNQRLGGWAILESEKSLQANKERIIAGWPGSILEEFRNG